MIGTRIAVTAALGAATLIAGSPVAQADPRTSPRVIESSAAQLCAAVDADPTADGVMHGMVGLRGGIHDEIDAALVLITAVHHVCPQHEDLVMGAIEPAAVDELCPKSS